MEITKVSRDINRETFQPIIKFEGYVSIESMMDTKAALGEKEALAVIGQLFVEQMQKKLNEAR